MNDSNGSIALTQHTPLGHGIAVSRWTEVCLSTQGSEDATEILLATRTLQEANGEISLSDVVRSIDTSSKGRVPPIQDAFDNLDAREVNVLDSGSESALN